MQDKKPELFKFTVELPMSYLEKINEICGYRLSRHIDGRFKRDVVMDAIDVLSHCYQNGDVDEEDTKHD